MFTIHYDKTQHAKFRTKDKTQHAKFSTKRNMQFCPDKVFCPDDDNDDDDNTGGSFL